MSDIAPDSSETPPLSAIQEAIALLLAGGATVREVARAGASQRSIYYWLSDVPAFRDRIHELRTEAFGRATGRLADLSAKAAEVLGRLMDSDTESVQLQAARSILEQAPKFRESVDMAARVAELKRWMDEVKNGAAGRNQEPGATSR